jgi:hypothetical protein
LLQETLRRTLAVQSNYKTSETLWPLIVFFVALTFKFPTVGAALSDWCTSNKGEKCFDEAWRKKIVEALESSKCMLTQSSRLWNFVAGPPLAGAVREKKKPIDRDDRCGFANFQSLLTSNNSYLVKVCLSKVIHQVNAEALKEARNWLLKYKGNLLNCFLKAIAMVALGSASAFELNLSQGPPQSVQDQMPITDYHRKNGGKQRRAGWANLSAYCSPRAECLPNPDSAAEGSGQPAEDTDDDDDDDRGCRRVSSSSPPPAPMSSRALSSQSSSSTCPPASSPHPLSAVQFSSTPVSDDRTLSSTSSTPAPARSCISSSSGHRGPATTKARGQVSFEDNPPCVQEMFYFGATHEAVKLAGDCYQSRLVADQDGRLCGQLLELGPIPASTEVLLYNAGTALHWMTRTGHRYYKFGDLPSKGFTPGTPDVFHAHNNPPTDSFNSRLQGMGQGCRLMNQDEQIPNFVAPTFSSLWDGIGGRIPLISCSPGSHLEFSHDFQDGIVSCDVRVVRDHGGRDDQVVVLPPDPKDKSTTVKSTSTVAFSRDAPRVPAPVTSLNVRLIPPSSKLHVFHASSRFLFFFLHYIYFFICRSSVYETCRHPCGDCVIA